MDPQMIKAVEILEVVNSGEEKIDVAQESFFDVSLRIPRNFKCFMP